MFEVVKIACWRVPGYAEMSSADLADAVTQPAKLRPMTLTEFFTACVDAGAVRAELSALMQFGELIRAVREDLHRGHLSGLHAIMAVAEDLVDLSPETKAAVEAVIAARSLRLVDVVAADRGEDAPETVTAEDIDAALGRS